MGTPRRSGAGASRASLTRVSEPADTSQPVRPRYAYRPEVLTALAVHGVIPKPTTSPHFLRGFLNELYRYELRGLRDRVLRGEFPHTELSAHVIVLRRRYPLMSIPVEDWTR